MKKHYWKAIDTKKECPECGLWACGGGGGNILFLLGGEKSLVKKLETQGYHQAKPKPSEEET
jgi:hypothetical protein